MIFQVNLGKRPRHNYGDSDEEASGQPESIMVSYQSTRSAETSTRDALATSEIQIDTEIGQDARTIFEKSLMGMHSTLNSDVHHGKLLIFLYIFSSAGTEG